MFLEIICATVLMLILLFIYVHWNRAVFRIMGVPTAPSKLFVGSLFNNPSLTPFESDVLTLKKYGASGGKIVGTFEGRIPVLLISEVELIRCLLLKQVSEFYDSRSEPEPSLLQLAMFNLHGSRWKHVRQCLSPLFTLGNLRRMTPLIEKCVDHLLADLECVGNGNSVDINRVSKLFTLRAISSIAFGVDLTSNPSQETRFLETANTVFEEIDEIPELLFLIIPHFSRPVMHTLDNLGFKSRQSAAIDKLASYVDSEIERRRQNNVSRDDLLQLVMSLETDYKASMSAQNWRGLTRREIVAQIVDFVAAGYETTASTLTFFCVAMAQNQECQVKLNAELIRSISCETDCPYLDWCILETLRLYPAINRIDRICTAVNGTNLGGIHIPFGMNVSVPITAVHLSNELFGENPDKFDPLRFSDADREKLLLTFGGGGHRNCVGERLAKKELRMAIASVFKHFKVQLSDLSQLPVEITQNGVRTPVKPVYLSFSKIL